MWYVAERSEKFLLKLKLNFRFYYFHKRFPSLLLTLNPVHSSLNSFSKLILFPASSNSASGNFTFGTFTLGKLKFWMSNPNWAKTPAAVAANTKRILITAVKIEARRCTSNGKTKLRKLTFGILMVEVKMCRLLGKV